MKFRTLVINAKSFQREEGRKERGREWRRERKNQIAYKAVVMWNELYFLKSNTGH